MLAMRAWFIRLNCQSATRSAPALGLLKNSWLPGDLALSMVLQLLVRCAPPMDALFHTVQLSSASLAALAS